MGSPRTTLIDMGDLRTLTTRVMVGIIAIAQPIDVWTTNRALASDRMVEANPVMAAVMAHLGSYYWLPKIALAIAVITLTYFADKIKSPVVVVLCSIVAKFYVVVLLNNYFRWL